MELKFELFVKIALGIVLVGLIAKVGANYFFHILDRLSGSGHNQKHDLDAMIEAKKQMIRTGEYGSYLSSPPPLPGDALKPKVENLFRALLNSTQTSEEKKAEIKRILAYFEEATWGGGQSFEKLKSIFKQQTELSLDVSVFVKAFRFVSARQLIGEKQGEEEIKRLLLVASYLQKILSESLERQGMLLRLISQKEHLAPFHVARAAEMLFFREQNQNETHLYSYLLQTKEGQASELTQLSSDEKDRLCEKILLKKNTTISELHKQILSEAQLFASLTPLSPAKSLAEAYFNLGLSESHSDEEIKRAYRKMALERHPDRLAGKKISKSYVDIAHKNFHIIHDSLNMIMSHRKKNA